MTGPKLDDVPAMYQVRPRSFPAGEGWREVSKREFDNYGDFPGYPEVEWERRKLYAAQQPAPAIDLEQFRPALEHARLSIQSEEKRGEIDRLLALIDGQANVRSSSEHSEPALIGGQAAPRPLAEWHEDFGAVMWWAWCGSDWAGEPAWCGTPNVCDWPGYHTHWTPHPAMPLQPTKGEGE